MASSKFRKEWCPKKVKQPFLSLIFRYKINQKSENSNLKNIYILIKFIDNYLKFLEDSLDLNGFYFIIMKNSIVDLLWPRMARK